MGSDSDWPVMQSVVEVLERPGGRKPRSGIASAHRTPAATSAYVEKRRPAGAAARCLSPGRAWPPISPGAVGRAYQPARDRKCRSSRAPLAGMECTAVHRTDAPPASPVATVAVGKAGRHERRVSRGADTGALGPGARGAALPRTGRSGPERFRTRTPRCSASSAPERPGHVRGLRAGARPFGRPAHRSGKSVGLPSRGRGAAPASTKSTQASANRYPGCCGRT